MKQNLETETKVDRFIDIAYEDKDIIVVNKPRGILVVGEGGVAAAGKRGPETLTDKVRGYLLRKFKGAKGAFVKPVHRLDRETTGLVIFAKSKDGLLLSQDIKEHRVRRLYLAIVEGAVDKEEGSILLPLEKGDFGHGRKVAVANKGEGKMSVTQYRVVERYEHATLLKVNLKTGFTHQIRVHLASIGHPLIGDKVYNPHSRIKFPRQALHSLELVFSHPVSRKKIEVGSSVPKDMENMIDKLREFGA